ncbi:MAG TPA: uroporphyrinogen decarboxylase family protein [Bacilli bacterium]|nr:uroporphyrinogen decarboxylase family protein [Bacilli bacterium]
MKNWILRQTRDKSKTTPILFFPAARLLGITIKELVHSAPLQARAMRAIADLYPTSAALSMMDLSVEAEAFGSEIRFFDADVPTVIGRLVKDRKDAEKLAVPNVGLKRDGIYVEGVRQAAGEIKDRPVFAGAIGPFSLAGRLMGMTEAMINCYEDPETVHLLLRKASSYIGAYIQAFKEAGAGGVVMAEPAAGLLNPQFCREFSSDYIKEIFEKVSDNDFIVVYHNCGNVIPLLPEIVAVGADVYHFGNSIDIRDALAEIPADRLVMGNINPTLFSGESDEELIRVTTGLLDMCGRHPNFVISSGCDIPPAADWNSIKLYFNLIRGHYGA